MNRQLVNILTALFAFFLETNHFRTKINGTHSNNAMNTGKTHYVPFRFTPPTMIKKKYRLVFIRIIIIIIILTTTTIIIK
uniref:Glycine receptor alpha 2 n=1 Tax=Homo sapiens TaxID=9606 RepID=A0A9S7JRE2_HUMAN